MGKHRLNRGLMQAFQNRQNRMINALKRNGRNEEAASLERAMPTVGVSGSSTAADNEFHDLQPESTPSGSSESGPTASKRRRSREKCVDREKSTTVELKEDEIFEPWTGKHGDTSNCPWYLKKLKQEYWSSNINGTLVYVNYVIKNKSNNHRTFDLLEEFCGSDDYSAYSCRFCKSKKVMAFYIVEGDVMLAAPASAHDCFAEREMRSQQWRYPSKGTTKRKGLLPIPDSKWIIPCDENNVIKDKIYLLANKNNIHGREFVFRGKRLDGSLVFVCNYCKDHDRYVHLVVEYDEKVQVTAEEEHPTTCKNNISLVDVLRDEIAVLTNPVF